MLSYPGLEVTPDDADVPADLVGAGTLMVDPPLVKGLFRDVKDVANVPW
nr:hypothetical protein [Arthrobacter terrae]